MENTAKALFFTVGAGDNSVVKSIAYDVVKSTTSSREAVKVP